MNQFAQSIAQRILLQMLHIVAIVDGEYSYKWSQLSAPKDSHGYIEGATTKNVKLTKVNDIVDMERLRLVSHILFHMGKFVF